MKEKQQSATRGYAVSNAVVRPERTNGRSVERPGLFAAVAIALTTGTWLVFALL